MKLYTKHGDFGKSKIKDKSYYKDYIYFDCIGEVDELNSILGLAKNCIHNERIYKEITTIQQQLFILAGEISSKEINEYIEDIHIKYLEDIADYYMKDIELNSFIIPGSNKESAYFHFARTVSRRAERRFVSCIREENYENKNIIKYLNRLSDALFSIAIHLEDELQSISG